MINKIYRGEPGGKVKVILPSGRSRPLRHILLDSPTGFAWGYEGSGPADLAMSLLCDVLGERPSKRQLIYGQFKAYPHHQDFERQIVAKWNLSDGFQINGKEVIDWLKKRGVEV
jgi:hypothetical protein